MEMKNLNAHTIPLTGKHLIEASAGTGKTYNITRIYLRLILEQELSVEEILLMTFTKDATQELRGRIDVFIRQALAHWHELIETDEYFKAISEKVNDEKAQFLLKRALLLLDDAAIHTIHGFCQKVLNQHAFTSGLTFDTTLSTNTNDITLQATQDWYRQLAKSDEVSFSLLAQFWQTPTSFIASFSKAISHNSDIALVSVKSVETNFVQLVCEALSSLKTNTQLLEDSLILSKKGKEQDVRKEEFNQLLLWLEEVKLVELGQDALLNLPYFPDAFIDGRRFSRSKEKLAIKQAFVAVNKVKSQLKSLQSNITKAKAFQVVRTGIYKIRQQCADRKEQLNVLDFDDLINTLAQCLTAKTPNAQNLAKALLHQYPVALIDEFQDTDPNQFSILQAVYYEQNYQHDKRGIFLIGDPKQAIYGFRGGDIFAYLSARAGCDHHWLMDTNWRSTPEMISAYNQVFTAPSENKKKSVFGFGIEYLPVLAGKYSLEKAPLKGSDQNDEALQVIHFSHQEDPQAKVNQDVRVNMAYWCANEIQTLLAHDDIKPKDIAILVRDGNEARDIKLALSQAQLDSVFLSERANLFHSTQAKQLLSILTAINDLENDYLFIAGLCSGLLGIDANKLYALQQDDEAYQKIKFDFITLRHEWSKYGFISMAIKLMHQYFDVALETKDRSLTNLIHLFELLQAASQRYAQPHELLHWFELQTTMDNPETEAELRLENDGDLIRIITQHGSKGLEDPIVFIPYATRHKDPLRFGSKSVNYIEYHNTDGQLMLSLDGSDEAKLAMSNEAYAEAIRLLYVAITRAEQRCYIFTCAFDKYHLSPLGKTLQWQEGQDIQQGIESLRLRDEQHIAVRNIAIEDYPQGNENSLYKLSHSSTANELVLEAKKFKGHIERDWWLSSFSALSRNMRHVGVSSPDRDTQSLVNSQSIERSSAHLLRFMLTKGAHSGNLLHDILEQCDFSAPNWQESIHWPLIKYGELPEGFEMADLVNWLEQIILCPLTPTICTENNSQAKKALTLSSLTFDKTLRESEFYFPMTNGRIEQLSYVLTEHRKMATCCEGIPYQRAIAPVYLPEYKKLTGMMHGFIDLIFQHNGKYFVCDYKSNFLGDDFSDYTYETILENIELHHYDLQYLIYSVALHRYLQDKVEGYQFERDFGGVYYLYLRGMTNEQPVSGNGVYFRKIQESEMKTLDNLFKGSDIMTSKLTNADVKGTC